MRIVAGKFKGRKLNPPKDDSIRPTTDKVKEAIFSTIGSYLDGGVVVDLFSGTGGLGLEALSRGAKICYFCDSSPESIRLTKSNIQLCGAENECCIIPGDYGKALSKIPEKADVIILDPPFEKDIFIPCFKKIYECDALKADGVIVVEHGVSGALPDNILKYVKIKEKKYGTVLVSLYVELNNGVC